jgi:CRP-like cAMP-binding protein
VIPEVARAFTAPAGAALFMQGDDADAVYFVTRGSVRVTSRLLGEGEVELATVGAGEVVGELALVDGGGRTETARAIDDVEGLAFDARTFAALRSSEGFAGRSVVESLAAIVSDRLAEITRALSDGAARPMGDPSPPVPAELPPRVIAQLARLPFFQFLSSETRHAVLSLGRVVELQAGEALFYEGGDATEAYVVLHGSLQVSAGGRRIGVVGPGRVAGLPGVLGSEASHVERCTTRDGALLLAVDAGDLAQLASGRGDGRPAVLDALLADLITTLGVLRRRLAGLAALRSATR